MASGGSGSKISTLLAEERSLNWLRAFTRYSVRLRLCFSTVHSTQISGRTFWLSRYVLLGLALVTHHTCITEPMALIMRACAIVRHDAYCTAQNIPKTTEGLGLKSKHFDFWLPQHL